MSHNLTVADQRPRFHEFTGATLEWYRFGVAHQTLYLRVSNAAGAEGLILLIYLLYADCPITMHDVHLRLATAQECDSVRQRLPTDNRDPLRPGECLVVDGNEGRAIFAARVMTVRWKDEGGAVFREAEESDAPLWAGGPPLSQL